MRTRWDLEQLVMQYLPTLFESHMLLRDVR